MVDDTLKETIASLYDTFSAYGPGTNFCKFCYSDAEIDYISKTPVRELDVEHARVLLWETGDHWENAEVYRHYLPRMLEIMAPPTSCADLYPLHLFETLAFHKFDRWPSNEREVLCNFLRLILQHLANAEDRSEWEQGIHSLLPV